MSAPKLALRLPNSWSKKKGLEIPFLLPDRYLYKSELERDLKGGGEEVTSLSSYFLLSYFLFCVLFRCLLQSY